jgi:hypothetical protein
LPQDTGGLVLSIAEQCIPLGSVHRKCQLVLSQRRNVRKLIREREEKLEDVAWGKENGQLEAEQIERP